MGFWWEIIGSRTTWNKFQIERSFISRRWSSRGLQGISAGLTESRCLLQGDSEKIDRATKESSFERVTGDVIGKTS